MRRNISRDVGRRFVSTDWFGVPSLIEAVTRPTALGRRRNLTQFLLELAITQISNEQAPEEAGIGESRCISRRDNLLQLAAPRLILRTLSESQWTICNNAIPHTWRVVMSPNCYYTTASRISDLRVGLVRFGESPSPTTKGSENGRFLVRILRRYPLTAL